MVGDDRGVLAYLDQLPNFDGRPRFFLFLPDVEPHRRSPNAPIPPFPAGRKRSGERELEPSRRSRVASRYRAPWSYLETVGNYYDNGVLQADFVIDEIFSNFKERGYLEDGLVIISADHGDTLGEHNHHGHSFRLYNTDIRIPLLVWDSDPTPRPKELPIAAQPNIAPTILSRLGLPIPAAIAATSLDLPQEHFESQHVTRRQQQPCAAAIAGTRQRLYKLMVCTDRRSPVSEELYEVIADPGEKHDLLQDPARQAEASRAFARTARSARIFLRGYAHPAHPAPGPHGCRGSA